MATPITNSIYVHHTATIEFNSLYRDSTGWLSIRCSGGEERSRMGISIFYGHGLAQRDVIAAMKAFIEQHELSDYVSHH